ncbi:hypothetical protein [Marinomonas colpomeniae]|uniref:Uncharacterized protein n=1 Tax=Marinomonas colpomeniae TaxID=2774408 RepID=A0ABR8NUX9_9GAMM|nr:hypothetical protein [Marinomonas colpomeniae]MBD5769708.1 hypothetical protein [Marinomonas colpomeniae]
MAHSFQSKQYGGPNTTLGKILTVTDATSVCSGLEKSIILMDGLLCSTKARFESPLNTGMIHAVFVNT